MNLQQAEPGTKSVAMNYQQSHELFQSVQAALGQRYLLEHELGRGSMGIVYRAHETSLDRPVALKVLWPRLTTPEIAELFLKEAKTAAKLAHPNIVRIYAADWAGPFVFYAMEYVDGETLGSRMRRTGYRSVEEVTRIMDQALDALIHAHGRRVIHRDLTPDNILLESDGDRVRVTDFSIARVRAAWPKEPEGEGVFEGTPMFTSPEQANKEEGDERSDLYSAAAVMYMAACGEFVFGGLSQQMILYHHMNTPAPPLPVVGKYLDRTLARVVARGLKKDPAERFQKAEDMKAALSQATELRQKLAIPLRGFVNRVRIMTGSTAFIVGGGLLFGTPLVRELIKGEWRKALVSAMLTALVVLGPPAVLLQAVIRVLAAGFGRADLYNAVGSASEEDREEHAALHGTLLPPGPGESRPKAPLPAAAWACLAGGVLLALSLALMGANMAFPQFQVGEILVGRMLLPGVVLFIWGGIAWANQGSRAKPPGKRWLEFWGGWRGKWIVRIASLFVHRDADAVADDRWIDAHLALGRTSITSKDVTTLRRTISEDERLASSPEQPALPPLTDRLLSAEGFQVDAVAAEFGQHVANGKDPVILWSLIEAATDAAAQNGVNLKTQIEQLRQRLERDGYRLRNP